VCSLDIQAFPNFVEYSGIDFRQFLVSQVRMRSWPRWFGDGNGHRAPQVSVVRNSSSIGFEQMLYQISKIAYFRNRVYRSPSIQSSHSANVEDGAHLAVSSKHLETRNFGPSSNIGKSSNGLNLTEIDLESNIK